MRDVKSKVVRTVVEGRMRGCRLTQQPTRRMTVILSLDGLCGEFAEGARVRVTMERI